MSSDNTFHNRYSLVKGVARRARQLQSGAAPMGKPTSMKACRIAQDEIRSGQVRYVIPAAKQAVDAERQTL